MFRQIKLFQILKHDSWVRPFLRRYRKSLILAISLGILTFICAAGLMFSAGYLISRAAEQPVNILLVYVPIVLTRAFGIGRPTLHYAERLVSHNWVLKMTSKLRQRLYDALETDAIFWRRRYQLGDLLGLLADLSHAGCLGSLRDPDYCAGLAFTIAGAGRAVNLWLDDHRDSMVVNGSQWRAPDERQAAARSDVCRIDG